MTEPSRTPRPDLGQLYDPLASSHQLLAQSADVMARAQAALDDARLELERANVVRAQATIPHLFPPKPDST